MMAVAVFLAVVVGLWAPAPAPSTAPTTTPRPGTTVTLDDLEAMLTDSLGPPPASFELVTPDGPVTVIVPTTAPTTTTTAPATTASTTTTTTTTAPPRPPTPVPSTGDLLDQLLGLAVPTIPEGAEGVP